MSRTISIPAISERQATAHTLRGAPRGNFLRDVLTGLAAEQKSIPAKYFYDRTGSELFERICAVEEYYPTRTELWIMRRYVREISSEIGSGRIMLELGSGSSLKTRLLLENLQDLKAYLPLDISRSALDEAVRELKVEFPGLPVHPLVGDFQHEIAVPKGLEAGSNGTLVYFPGSTIGNLSPDASVQLLRRLRGVCRNGGVLLGTDLQKDVPTLERAYNDAEGVTAAFNLNLLHRMNRELRADFDCTLFDHRAIYSTRFHRVEMHLISSCDQLVEVAGNVFRFRQGESICTEHSHKFTIPGLQALAAAAGFDLKHTWTDERNWFAVSYLTPHR